MDWFKKKKDSVSPAQVLPKAESPPPSVAGASAVETVAAGEPSWEEKLATAEEEHKETLKEYVRKLESLATVVFEKSEENEQLNDKLAQQEQDMTVLLDKLVAQEKELETYKENQVEYKRRLEVLTDCLEDLARENMKLASRGAPSLAPADYEDEKMPTAREVQMGKAKSNVMAETAVRSGSSKISSRPPPSSPAMKHDSEKPASSTTSTPSTDKLPATTDKTEQTKPTPIAPAPVKANAEPTPEHKDNLKKDVETPQRRFTASPAGGLVLPSRNKSKADLSTKTDAPKDSTNAKNAMDSPSTTSKTTPSNSSSPALDSTSSTTSTASSHHHKRIPSTENDFSSMSNDPQALMAILKKYKAQVESMRRDLIREKQKSESLQLSIDKYEETTVSADKTYRDNLQKEARRRKDAEYIANVLKKRVTELQFLLDEKDDSDHDSDSDSDKKAKDEDDDEPSDD